MVAHDSRKRIEQKGKWKKREYGRVEMGGGESMVEWEDESDILIGMREKDE